MRMLDKLNPPFAVSTIFLVLAVVAVLLALLLLLLPLFRRLYRRATLAHLAVPTHVRTKYEAEIDALHRRWAAGELSGRSTAQELSTLVRRFAHEAWDIDIEHMTLKEIRQAGIKPVAAAVENLYLPAFGTAEIDDVSANLREIKKLVGMWTF